MTETAPCPWCKDGGKPFPQLNRDPFMSYAVRCYVCFAAGPHVMFEPTQKRPWTETIEEPIAQSIERWNELYDIVREVLDPHEEALNLVWMEQHRDRMEDPNEESSTSREDNESPDTDLAGSA